MLPYFAPKFSPHRPSGGPPPSGCYGGKPPSRQKNERKAKNMTGTKTHRDGTRALTAGGTGSGAGQNPYSFKAGIQDRGTGLVKFGLRWYEPTTGTWTQQDTLDAPLNPNDANRYGFAGGDPINAYDPTGRNTFTDYAGGCAVGAATNTGIGLGLGAITGGTGLAVSLGVGCVSGAIGVAIDKYTPYGPGVGYIGFLRTLNTIGKAIR
jgi:RHS repeat-associated protein